MATRAAHPRALLLLPAGLSMLAGTVAALHLLGLPAAAPVVAGRWAAVHGPVMVLGFVGAVVALERAVALRNPWGYASPALLGLGGVALLSPAPRVVGQVALLGGALGLVAVYAWLWRRSPAPPLVLQQLGAVCGAGAATLWLVGVAVPFAVPWLVGFLVLTVLGERLELGAVGRVVGAPGAGRAASGPGRQPSGPGRAASGPGPRVPVVERLAVALGAAYVVVASVALVLPRAGYVLLGGTLGVLVVTVLRGDVALRTVRAHGLTRFMAVAMLAGYAWLLVAAGTWLVGGPAWQGRAYDAVLHSVFLGFVLSMIMAHASVILPAVVRRPLPYRPAFYGPLLLLHASLLVRVLGGDAWGMPLAVQVGGVLNVVALLGFVALAAGSAAVGATRGDAGPEVRPARRTTEVAA